MSGSGNVLSVVTCFGGEVGTMAASRIGSGCRFSYVPLVTFV
jgi:hypothetical protein